MTESQKLLNMYLGYFREGEDLSDVRFVDNDSWMRIHQPVDGEEDSKYCITYDDVDRDELDVLFDFIAKRRNMNGFKELAQMIVTKRDESKFIQYQVNNSPEPLRTMVYAALGDDTASVIDGTDLYHAIVDELELIY